MCDINVCANVVPANITAGITGQIQDFNKEHCKGFIERKFEIQNISEKHSLSG